MKADQERVSKLLTDTVTLLCKNGLIYSQEIKVQGLLGITLDNKEVFLVQINEVVGGTAVSVSATASSGDAVRKKGSVSSSVVDLTRIADTPVPVAMPQSHLPSANMMPHGMMPMSMSGARKQRQAHPQPPQVMMPQLMPTQMPGRPTYNPRMRMNAASMQQAYNNQFAASYMARLQQQVAMAPPPMRMMSGSVRHRGSSRRQSAPIAAAAAPQTIDDEEDVVIIGTGHEEPSPSWNSPSRRQMSSTRAAGTVSSEGRSKTTSQVSVTSPSSGINSNDGNVGYIAANTHTSAIQDVEDDRAASDVEVTGTLELSAEDIPPSVEQLVLRATSGLMSDADGNISTLVVQPDEHSNSNTAKVNDGERRSDDDVVTQNIAGAQSATAEREVAEGLSRDVSSANKNARGSANNVADKSNAVDAKGVKQSLVYTDNAMSDCDVGNAVKSSTAHEIAEVPGFEVLISEDSSTEAATAAGGESRIWTCRFAGCTSTYSSADQLAEHYQRLHADTLDLARMSTSAEVSSRDSGETASTLGDGSAGGQDCFECSVPDCGTRLASHAGLMAHQRNVHGIHPSGPQTATASQQQRKRRADDMPSEQPAKIAANRGNVTAAGKPGTSTSGRFLCPVAGCTAQYCNRKDIYDHVQLAHQSKDSSNINLQSVKTCKEEVTDDGITFEKE